MDVFEILKDQVAFLDIFQHYFTPEKIKKTGKTYNVNPCPFCSHKDCFKIDAEKELFNCFSCGKAGSIIDFVMAIRNIAEPIEAAKQIADAAGIKLDFSTNGRPKPEPDPEEETRAKIFNAAAEWYFQQLISHDHALKILLDTRKYSKAFLNKIKLVGYSGGKWGELRKHLHGQGFKDDDLLKSGLFYQKDGQGKLIDYFPPEYVIYFHKIGEQTCSFSSKWLFNHTVEKGERKEKYFKTEFEIKNVIAFNQDALNGEEVIFVEGQNDLLQILNSEFKEACQRIKDKTGKVTEEDIEKIRLKMSAATVKYFGDDRGAYLKRKLKGRKVYLAYDQDNAGRKLIHNAFDCLWGISQLQVTAWDVNQSGAKDIDELLRHQIDPAAKLDDLKKASMEAFNFLIHEIEDHVDIHIVNKQLEPLKDKLLQCDDQELIDISLEVIRGYFKNSSVAKLIEKRVNERAFQKARSGANVKYLPYKEDDGIYFRKHKNGPIGLSNFVLRIRDVVLMDEEIFYRCSLINDQGDIANDVIFDAADRSNARKFKERCASRGAYYFTGFDSDLAGIWQLEESRQRMDKTYYIKHYGEVKAENMYLFADCAIKNGALHTADENGFIKIENKNYRSYDVLVYSGAHPRLDLETVFTKQFAQQAADNFHYMLDYDSKGNLDTLKGYLFLGFVPAVLYASEIYERFGFFPFLFSYGPSGTGKTEAMKLLLNCFGFISSPESWPSATKDGTHKFLQQLSSLPCWYDEFLNDKTFDLLFNTLKNIYNRVGSGKGGLKKRQIQEVNGCLWLSGEDNPQNEALLSRSVIFRFDRLNEHKTKSYQWLLKNREKLSILTRQILMSKTDKIAVEIIKYADIIANYIMKNSDKMDYRVAMNHAIPAAALTALDIQIPDTFSQYVSDHANKAYSHKLTESPIYIFFEELSFLYNSTRLLENSVKYDSLDNRLYVHWSSTIRIIAKEYIQRERKNLPIKAESIKDYLFDLEAVIEKSFSYWITSTNKQRCIVFDLNKLPAKIREVIEFDQADMELKNDPAAPNG